MLTAALVGNPNVGKTTLFNMLTNSNEYVGNWAGVTVSSIEKYLDDSIKIVDLPGIYGLDTFSNEEKVAKEFLINENVDVIINIVDASNINRNLYLTTQLKQFNKPIILVLNKIDVAESKGININFENLSKHLNVQVIPIIAAKNKGIESIKEVLRKGDFLYFDNDNEYHYQNENEIYNYIEEVLSKCLIQNSDNKITLSEKIDRIALNKFLAYPIFIGIMFLIFEFTFSWVGQPLANIFDNVVNTWIIPHLDMLLSASSPWFHSLIIDGIVSGVGSVIVFLPVIMALFLGISFLEDSGYMTRATFIMDKLMRKMGVSGKAFIPLIIGFGCSVPALMATRTLESERDRKITALLVPLMSCNARLPVYVLFASVFFKGHEAIVVGSLYILGIVMAFIIALILKGIFFKQVEESFIVELSEYKMPEIKNLLKHTWEKGKDFIIKVGTVIFSASIILWVLSNFNFSGMVTMNESFLAYIGGLLAPIFKPLGFGNWQNSVALLTGIIAKEVVIGTMGVVYQGSLTATLPLVFNYISAYSFLVFVLLYIPCISLIATMKREYGKGMAIFSVVYQFALAWIISFLIYNIGAYIFRFI